MNQATAGDWVQIFNVVLNPEERATIIPDETKKVPLTMMVKGFMVTERASLGDVVKIRTVTDRVVKGELVSINPGYDISYGRPLKELLTIGSEARRFLAGGGKG